jgi:peroxiredoxin Q/BCP
MESGSLAPPFALPDQDGNVVSLASLAGRWVVLYFYPRDDTPGCTVEACDFTVARAALATLDAVVYGCSADSPASHQRFIAKHRLGIRLLSDADRSVMKAYGAWGKKVMYGKQVEGVIRSTVLIAPDGRVAHHWPSVKAAGHAEQVRVKLAALQGGEAAAPAGPLGKTAKATKVATATGAIRKAKPAGTPKVAAKPKLVAKPKPAAKAKAKAKKA